MTQTRTRQRGFSLVEVMIAVIILTGMTLIILSSTTFSSSIARLNSNAVAAKNIAQGYFEQMYIDTFADVDAANYPDIPQPVAADPDDPAIVWLDKRMLIPCAVDFDFKGFGVLTGGAVGTLTDGSQSWEPNEWAGDTVFIVQGTGAGQFAVIDSNSATTLNLNGTLAFAPGAGARYMINNGKTVEITTTWIYRGNTYSQTIESLVPNHRGADDLGF